MSWVKKDIKSHYDELQDYYKGFLTKAGQHFKNRKINVFLKFLNLKTHSSILDVGCADGVYTLEFAKMGFNMIGLDLSKKQLLKLASFSRELHHGIDLVLGDAENLPFKTRSLDGVISISTIRYVPNPQRAMLEFARVVKQRGRVIADFPYKYSPYFLFLKPLFLKPHPHDKHFSVREVKRLFRDSMLYSVQYKIILITSKSLPDRVLQYVTSLEKIIEAFPLLNRLASIIVCAGEKV